MLRIGKDSLTSPSFRRLVQGLKDKGKTCTVVETCCGGLINSSIMAIPGSSAVYYGGSVAYNTKRAQKLLLNDSDLHSRLLQPPSTSSNGNTGDDDDDDDDGDDGGVLSEADAYIQSKQHWTAETAVAFCDQMNVDYAIAEGGASGPTFRPKDLKTGFAVIAIAGKNETTGKAELLAQSTIRSTHANRQGNMRFFADAAADLAADTIGIPALLDESASYSNKSKEEEEESVQKHLDRATHLRGDAQTLQRMEDQEDAKFVVLNQQSRECLFSSETKLALLSKSQLILMQASKDRISESSFLGLDPTTKSPIFAVDIVETDDDDDNEGQQDLLLPPGVFFANTRTHASVMNPYDYELVLYATALSNWKRTHKYCSICASPLRPIQGGTCLECTSTTTTTSGSSRCGNLSWPRQDPSIIVLVTNPTGDKALLARHPRHPPRVHSCLAGFVEAGETLEQAVLREVHEEVGTRVDRESIRYVASQPWPFPRSFMIGFLAQADDTLPLQIDPKEILRAAWFDKAQVKEAAKLSGAMLTPEIAEQAIRDNPSLEVLIPPKGVVARTLIDAWLERD